MRTFDQGAHSLAHDQRVRVLAQVFEVFFHWPRTLVAAPAQRRVDRSNDNAASRARSFECGRRSRVIEIIRSSKVRKASSADARLPLDCASRRCSSPRMGAICCSDSLVRFVDPEQDLFQLRRTVEIGDAIMRHRALHAPGRTQQGNSSPPVFSTRRYENR